MYSKIAFIPFVLAPLALTAPTDGMKKEKAITLVAAHSTSPVHLREIAASENGFFIGEKTSTSCPLKGDLCPPGNVTSVIVNAESQGASMNVETPGGQLVYVKPNGALSYTPAHASGQVNNNGGSGNGFSYVDGTDGHPGQFRFQGWSWFACPVEGMDDKWQVFANVPGSHVEGCIDIDALGTPYTEGVAAWQYD